MQDIISTIGFIADQDVLHFRTLLEVGKSFSTVIPSIATST